MQGSKYLLDIWVFDLRQEKILFNDLGKDKNAYIGTSSGSDRGTSACKENPQTTELYASNNVFGILNTYYIIRIIMFLKGNLHYPHDKTAAPPPINCAEI